MSTHNIGFYEDLTKIIFELSSNTHLISSAVSCLSVSGFHTSGIHTYAIYMYCDCIKR